MENNIKIKKIIKTLYSIDYSKIALESDNEFIIHDNGVSEFTQYLKKIDMNSGIIVTPLNYKSGLFYSVEDGGYIYSSSKLLPETVTFSLNLYGLKRNSFFRIKVLAKDTDASAYITSDRSLTVVDDMHNNVIMADLKGYTKTEECIGFFKSSSNEVNLHFTLGKICIKDIIIEEVVLVEEEKLNAEEDAADEVLPEGKEILVAYTAFNLEPIIPDNFNGRYIPLTKIFGKGISVIYDKMENAYIIERDNSVNILVEPFTNINYVVDINTNKVECVTYAIDAVSADVSPYMLKQGFIKFHLVDSAGNKINYKGTGRFIVTIHKIV